MRQYKNLWCRKEPGRKNNGECAYEEVHVVRMHEVKAVQGVGQSE